MNIISLDYRKKQRLKYRKSNKMKKEYFKNNIIPKLRQKLRGKESHDDRINYIRISLVDNQYNLGSAQQKRSKKTPAA